MAGFRALARLPRQNVLNRDGLLRTHDDISLLELALGKMRKAFIGVGGFSLFVNLAMLIGPLYMLQVYDRVLGSQSRDTLIMLTILAVGLLSLSAVVESARSRLLVRAGANLDAALSGPLFAAGLRGRLMGTETSASQPLRDLDTLRSFLTGAGILALFDAPWTPIYLTVIFIMHPALGAVALIGAVIIVALALQSEWSTRTPLKRAGVASRTSNDFVDAFARNAEAIRAMGMLERLRTRWLAHHDEGISWQAQASDRAGTLRALAKLTRYLLQIIILCVGAWLAMEGAVSAGVMVAASIIMGRALSPVEQAIGHWRGFVEVGTARQRLEAELRHGADGPARTELPPPTGKIAVENVVLRLPGADESVLQFVSFDVAAGETLGLIGPTGAGKSSLARLLVGVWTPAMGTVRLDGADVADWPEEQIGRYLGYMPQTVELLPGTVADNITRFGPADDAGMIEAAQMAGAHDMILRLPYGYDTPVGDSGRMLSGGQRQRIGLARAIYGDARVIVLDEPNANLCAEGEAALCRALELLKQAGRTVVVISHRPSVMRTVDKLLVLNGGRVEMFGPRDEVLAALPRPVVTAQDPGRLVDAKEETP
jgi:PrtD family type I secretion system ABC transporter